MKLFPSLDPGTLGADDAVKATALIAACAVPPGAAVGLYFGFRWNKSPLHGATLQDAAIQ
eukprot:SAG31_NODE_10073_length_1187_cov_1.704044_1_plen_59_part_10